jgi:hypothetical protein
MSTFNVVNRSVDGGETLTEVVARRLRGQLAERRIKRRDVIEQTGWGRSTYYRKVSGQSALDTSEFDMLWHLFRISPVFLMTGKRLPDDRTEGNFQSDDYESLAA